MEKFQREFIKILKAGLSGKKEDISSDFDFTKAVQIAKQHNITPILYYGASNCDIPQEKEYMQELRQLTLRNILVSERQTYEIAQIVKAFEAENIEYMLLKGTIFKSEYPKPEMRTMGDADILIKLEQYSKIQDVMERLQYTFKYESDHELVWTKPSLFLELHKSIMTTYNKDFYSYFGSGWKIAKNMPNSSGYKMSEEDFYIFTFVHFTKHYRISGIGITHLIDMWVYSNAHPEINWAYVEKELEKMQLSEFHTNIKKTIAVWFENAEETDITDLITNVIFNSGRYGTAEMAIINRALQSGNNSAAKIKVSRFFGNVFPSYTVMAKKYVVLNKVPILLPFMWVVRFFEIIIHRKTHVKKFINETTRIENANIKENEQALHLVGLDFNSNV